MKRFLIPLVAVWFVIVLNTCSALGNNNLQSREHIEGLKGRQPDTNDSEQVADQRRKALRQRYQRRLSPQQNAPYHNNVTDPNTAALKRHQRQQYAGKFEASKKKMLLENAKHNRRRARLMRIRDLAAEENNTAVIERVDRLLEKEEQRFNHKRMMIRGKMMEAQTPADRRHFRRSMRQPPERRMPTNQVTEPADRIAGSEPNI
ncbi:MAG: hypothetical protein ABIG61_14245 [Planctomycetota bacterium]